jgi:hypothetical protein
MEIELENRRVYRINSRNLAVGVYRAETDGFIGIREKFGSYSLFEEYVARQNGGTAWAIEAFDLLVPEDIELVEYLKGERLMYGRMVEGLLGNDALKDFLKVPDALAAHRSEEEWYVSQIGTWVAGKAPEWATKQLEAFH